MRPFDPKWADAISGIESSGRYSLLGPVTKTGDRAYGKYQVMGSNVPEWTRQSLGRQMTPQEFLSDPAAQDAVFKDQFGRNVDKYGSPQDAASVWFSGRPISKAGNARDILGTTVPAYVAKFNRYMGDGVSAIDAAMRTPRTPSGATSVPFDTTPPPDDGFLGQLGVPAGFASRLGAAGAAMMALDNPSGAAAINHGINERQLNEIRRAMAAQKMQTAAPVGSDFKYDDKSGTFYRTGVDGSLEMQKNPNAVTEAAPGKPMGKISESSLKNVQKTVDDYDFINSTAGQAADILDNIKTGKLDLGLVNNLINSGRGVSSLSNEQSRAYASYTRFIQDLVNSNLRLNNGVQTEGDAWRELKSIAANGTSYDNKTAEDALMKVIEKAKGAATRGAAHLESRKKTFGEEPFEGYNDTVSGWQTRMHNIDERIKSYKRNDTPSPAPSTAPSGSGGFRVIRKPY